MSLRETISQGPYRGLAVGAVLAVVGLFFVFAEMPGRGAPATTTQGFFSVDDGKTWFADDVNKLPPFDKDGKQAVRAYVFRSSDGVEFVNHLERLKPDAKRILEEVNKPDPKGNNRPNLSAIHNAYTGGREVKRPGAANWIDSDNFHEAGKVMAVKCPNGGSTATEVEP